MQMRRQGECEGSYQTAGMAKVNILPLRGWICGISLDSDRPGDIL
jgi:hypothetical protein